MSRTVLGTLLLWLTLAFGSSALGAQLVIESGNVSGARWVAVGDDYYHVDFRDGTCVDLYSGCDEESDFTFNWMTPATVQAARTALMEQVFFGPFDEQPEATRGCTDTSWCNVFFPIQKLPAPDEFGVAFVSNNEDELLDFDDGEGAGNRLFDTTVAIHQTYAVWSGPVGPPPVPIPRAAGALVALAISGLAARRLRAKDTR